MQYARAATRFKDQGATPAVFKIAQSMAMDWTKLILTKKISSTTITNCFKTTTLVDFCRGIPGSDASSSVKYEKRQKNEQQYTHSPWLLLYIQTTVSNDGGAAAAADADEVVVDQEIQSHIAIVFGKEAAAEACSNVANLIAQEATMPVVEELGVEPEMIDESLEEEDYGYVDPDKKHWPEQRKFLLAVKDALDLDHELDFGIVDAIDAKIAAKDREAAVDTAIQSTISSFFKPVLQ